jgi:hypothetical protein
MFSLSLFCHTTCFGLITGHLQVRSTNTISFWKATNFQRIRWFLKIMIYIYIAQHTIYIYIYIYICTTYYIYIYIYIYKLVAFQKLFKTNFQWIRWFLKIMIYIYICTTYNIYIYIYNLVAFQKLFKTNFERIRWFLKIMIYIYIYKLVAFQKHIVFVDRTWRWPVIRPKHVVWQNKESENINWELRTAEVEY